MKIINFKEACDENSKPSRHCSIGFHLYTFLWLYDCGCIGRPSAVLWPFLDLYSIRVVCPFDANGIQLFPQHPQPLWQLFPLASSAIYIYLLITIRSSSKISTKKDSFSPNINLANWSLKILVLSLCSHIELVEMLISFFTFHLILTLGLLLAVPPSGSLARF